MPRFEKKLEIRWSDLDPNYHVRHSAYYDYGAYCRVAFLNQQGITSELMLQHNIGPILLKESCVFKREIKFGDEVMINVKIEKATPDMSRWTMVHEIWKSGTVLAAILTVEGAWIDTKLRKMARPPADFVGAFDELEKTDNFEYTVKK